MQVKQKKLLFIVEAMGGGVFTYIVDLANELVEIFDVYIAYSTRAQTPDDFRSHFDNRINLIEVKSFTRSVDIVNDMRSYLEIKKLTTRVQPDIVHLHSSKAGVLGRLALNGRKIPLFYTPHGYSFLMEDSGL